jgi:hypothetical protein
MMKDYQRGCFDQRYFVMAGHSRPQDGVAFARLCPATTIVEIKKPRPRARPGLELFR